jgi:PTH1 family peptidyl-tRNA hydrolase
MAPRENEKRKDENMYIIVGLGNPGKEYEGTRHNAGFMVIDRMAEKYGIDVNDEKFKGLLGKGIVEGNKVLLVKPQTYMNNSGECVRSVMDYYKADIDDVIVVFDDISLEPGKLRLRPKGSAGGHNGIKSIIAHLGSEGFKRVKFGVGDKPKGWDLVDWVLGRFKAEDANEIEAGIERACAALVWIMNEGIESGMNHFNG